jgi:hypothetical protein
MPYQTLGTLSEIRPNSGKPDARKADGRLACVVDLDNMLHRGFDRQTKRPRPQADIDVMGLSAELYARGVSRGTVCRNREFSLLASAIWRAKGFKVLAAHKNCDNAVIDEALTYAKTGIDTLILIAGDGDYTDLVKELRRKGICVEVWARSYNISTGLAKAASNIRFVDRFVKRAA